MAAIRASLPPGTPIEIWWQDEARIGQKNGITRRWARRGTRPSAPKDQRTKSAYIYGAICPAEGKAAGLALPRCNTEGMTLHLAEIAATVAAGAHAVLLLDQAGWHGSEALVVPSNITLLPLPSKCPELNAVENVWTLVDGIFSMIVDTASKGEEVSISGFGKFKVKETAEREGGNPATAETMTIAAGRKMGFAPAKAVKDKLNA